jgi:hypothetical protein
VRSTSIASRWSVETGKRSTFSVPGDHGAVGAAGVSWRVRGDS